MKCIPVSLSRLLLGGLCAIVLSACAQTIQPWVQPEISQEMKRLKVENYLIKHDIANLRKKLMQANLQKRKLAKKLQDMRNRPQSDDNKNANLSMGSLQQSPPPKSIINAEKTPPIAKQQPKQQLEQQKVAEKPQPAASKEQAEPSHPLNSPASEITAPAAVQKPAVLANAPLASSPLTGSLLTKMTPPHDPLASKSKSNKATADASDSGKVAASGPPVSEPSISEPSVNKQNNAAPEIKTPIVEMAEATANAQKTNIGASNSADWELQKRFFFGSGHKGTSPAMRRQITSFAQALPATEKIRIGGHSDGEPVGGYAQNGRQSAHNLADNKAVSLERAMSVVRALVAAGIASDRIQVAGFGATNPLAANDTEAGRAKNRRVEIFTAKATSEKPVSAPALQPSPTPSTRPIEQTPVVISALSETVGKQPENKNVTKEPATTMPDVKLPETKPAIADRALKTKQIQTKQTETATAKAADTQNWEMNTRLFFDAGQKWTSPKMRRQLRTFANALPATAKIRIVGHADGLPIHQPTASLADNKAMSMQRAQSVFRGLKAYGVPVKRMQVEALGATEPLAANDSAEGRAKNRRVEIFVSPIFVSPENPIN
ncbi:MAG: OmpA family protein [Mariprofundaceae bacterium]